MDYMDILRFAVYRSQDHTFLLEARRHKTNVFQSEIGKHWDYTLHLNTVPFILDFILLRLDQMDISNSCVRIELKEYTHRGDEIALHSV